MADRVKKKVLEARSVEQIRQALRDALARDERAGMEMARRIMRCADGHFARRVLVGVFPPRRREMLWKADAKRLRRNERRRAAYAVEAERRRVCAFISHLPPWMQAERYGWTAERGGRMDREMIRGSIDMIERLPAEAVVGRQLLFALAAAVRTGLSSARGLLDEARRLARGRDVRGMAGGIAVQAWVLEEIEGRRRLGHERRKHGCGSTLAACPTPEGLVRAFFDCRTTVDMLRLGGMVNDLECFVDNSLRCVVRHVRRNGRLEAVAEIIGRRPGVKGWLADHCPLLRPHYRRLMRCKQMASAFRQAIDLPHPVPTEAAFAPAEEVDGMLARPVSVQPGRMAREGASRSVRFAHELAETRSDVHGRQYHLNPNYRLPARMSPVAQPGGRPPLVPDRQAVMRSRAIAERVLSAAEARHGEADRLRGRHRAGVLNAVLAEALARIEEWWGGMLSNA